MDQSADPRYLLSVSSGGRAQVDVAEMRIVAMYLLSGTLLRLSSVKAGMMVGMMIEEEEREEGAVLKKGLNGYMVLLPRSCRRGVPLPLSHAQGILRYIKQGTEGTGLGIMI